MISNSTISNSVFQYNAQKLEISNATIERCQFQGLINDATITGNLTKCQFEGLSNGITINGPLNDMTIQVDITPNSAFYVQSAQNPSQLTDIQELIISTAVVPRLSETLHKDCYIATINPGNKVTFVVQIPTDDTNPSGIILMFYPGTIPEGKTLADVIPKGYALCDGNNGTPNLEGRFIRAAISKEDVGYHNNSDLSVGDSGRKDSIQIKAENLPPHQHYFKLDNVSVDISGLSISEYSYSYSDTISYSSYSGDVNSGTSDGSSYSGDSVGSGSDNININFTHSHTLSGTAYVSGNATQDQSQETFQNNKICVEPESYALVFIMKL